MLNPQCNDIRLGLSAQLDREPAGLPAAVLEAHLGGCAMCRAWLEGAQRVTRAIRVQPVAVPDLTARILAAVRADGALAGRGQRGWRMQAQLALGALTVIQLMIAVASLLGQAGHDAHAGREVAALDTALSVGLLLTALYPEYARIFVPVVATLIVCFAAIGTLDLLAGVVTPSRLAVHALAAVQAALVWSLARSNGRRLATA